MSIRTMQVLTILVVLSIGALFINMTRVAFNPSPWKNIASTPNAQIISTGGYGGYTGNNNGSNSGQYFNSYIVGLNQHLVPNIENCDYRLKVSRRMYNGYTQSYYWTKAYLPVNEVFTTTHFNSSININFDAKETQLENVFASQGYEPIPLDRLKLSVQVSKNSDELNASMHVSVASQSTTGSLAQNVQIHVQEKCPNNESETSSTVTTISESPVSKN